jgi:hypothetical protein
MSKNPERFNVWMTAARQSPHFGVRLLAQLSPAARAEAVRCWSQPSSAPVSALAPAKPGLKKCSTPAPLKTFSSVQLEAFARSVGRVG